jgi:hypothetical protein
MESKTFEFSGVKIVLAHVICFGAQGASPNRQVFIEFLNGKIMTESHMTYEQSTLRMTEIDRAINEEPYLFTIKH